MDPLPTVEFWLALGQIAAASLLLAGDNAIVIALAARRFPLARRQAARRTGSIAAVALRIALCPLAVWLLALPLAGLAAGLLLGWTALRLLVPERAGPLAAATGARSVLPFILMADIAMAAASAVAIAGAARGNAVLIALGLLVSIPLIAAGGRIVLAVLPRTPLLLAAGAGLLGWIAGGIMARDPALAGLQIVPSPATVLPSAGALLVVALGTWLARRAGRRPGPITDLAPLDLQ